MRRLRAASCAASLALFLGLPALAAPLTTSDDAVLATKAAMDAFFAVDGAIPRVASDDQPAPSETEDHDDLIATLDQLLARGARLDRFRWHGTMLHHSLRAGFSDVTHWLLAHGADPLQKITPGEGDLDALGIAVRLHRWDMVRILLRYPAYRRLSPAEVSQRLWAGVTTDETAQALRRQKLLLPKPTGQDLRLLAAALQARDVAQVDRLLAVQPGRLSLHQAVDARQARVAEVWPLQRWRQLDARLELPVLPWALARAGTEAEVRALLTAGLRAPWSDALFSADVARLLPASALPGLLLRPPAGMDLGPLWAAVARERIPDLKKLPLQDWQTYVASAPSIDVVMASLPALPRRLPDGPGSPETEDQSARWLPVVERMRTVPATYRRELWAGRWRLDTVMRELPAMHMPEFVAWAAADDMLPDVLPHLVVDRQPSDYEMLWPALRQQSPALADELLPALLSRLWVDPPRSRLADSMTGWSAGDVGLARWLVPHAPRVTPHRLRAGLVAEGSGWRDADLVKWGVAEGLALHPEPVAAPTPGAPAGAAGLRVVLTPADCIAVASPALRLAFVSDGGGWLQPVAAPHQAQCLWLKTWESVTGGGWSDESFFDGFATHIARSTIEQTLHVERWDEVARRFVAVQEEFFTSNLVEVELMPGGERFWLGLMNDANGRRGPGGFKLDWQDDGKPVFKALPAGSTLDDRWRSLIDTDSGDVQIQGLMPEDAQVFGPREPRPISRFIAEHWGDDRLRFLGAFAALDREALAAQRRAGIFASWLDEAVLALSEDEGLALEAKRRRMAWLLATPAYAAGLGDAAVRSLRDWLPAEDWGPILAPRRCGVYTVFSGDSEARRLTSWAQKAPPALRRRIEVALARDCDGEVR